MTGIFLQARLDSTRLPGKALLPLGDRTVTEQALRALSEVTAEVRALLTDRNSALALAPLARRAGWRVYIGPKEDVLARFAGAVRHFSVDTVIRATGDNPLVCPDLAEEALERFRREGADYCGLTDIPVGAGVEILEGSSLLLADREARDPYDREHVAPFLYRNPDRFRICRVPASRPWSGRITLDTREDYEYLSRLFDRLYSGERISRTILEPWLAENAR